MATLPANPIPFSPALRAYGAQGGGPLHRAPAAGSFGTPTAPAAASAHRAAQIADRVELLAPGAKQQPKVQNLVAGRVPTGIDFTSGPEPKPAAASPIEAAKAAAQPGIPVAPAAQRPQVDPASLVLQLYRHPADKIAAATDVALGRILDRVG